MTKAMNTEAYERATKRPWAEWITLLDELGARELEHQAIVPLVQRELEQLDLKSPGWWAQGITIAYEQHIGRRLPGQKPDGSFASSASRSYPGSMDDANFAWTALVKDRTSFVELDVADGPSASATPKWRYWRCTLADDSRVNVTINEIGPAKSRVSVEHSKLTSTEAADEAKFFWKLLLSNL